MGIPITALPESIVQGLAPYRDLFPRGESFRHIMEYATGLVLLEKPSIRRLAECLVEGPDQSSINKALTQSPWSEEQMNTRRLELITPHYQGQGLVVGILDSSLLHHPRSKKMYGVYPYWDYVEGCYTKGMQVVTSAISTPTRCDGFDFRIYHRFFQKEERAYLEVAHPASEEQDPKRWGSYLGALLAYHLHQREHKTKPQLAVDLLEKMEKSGMAPDCYVVDNGLFSPILIQAVESHHKPWVADSEKTRLLFEKGKKYHLKDYEAQLPDKAFRRHTLTVQRKKRTFWVFTKVVRIRTYGKVRLAIIYDNPNRQGNPIFCFTNQVCWEAKKILTVRTRRWDIEPFHEQIKQFLGAEDSQLQTEKGVRRHLTLVFVVNSLLQSLNMTQRVAGLAMEGRREDSQWTFGQRRLRIVLEVFQNLIRRILQWGQQDHLTFHEIFQRLFAKMCVA